MAALPRMALIGQCLPVGLWAATTNPTVRVSACHPAAIDHQVLAGDERRLVGGEEQRGIGDILRTAEPRQRRAAVAVVDPARLDGAAALAGEDLPRRDGIADDRV